MSELTKNSTNQEILDAFGSKIAAGKPPVVYCITDAKNAEYAVVYAFQRVNQIGGGAASLFNGWFTDMRCVQSIKKSVLNEMKIKVGTVLKGFEILREEAFEPFYDNQENVLTPEGEDVFRQGNIFYRNHRLETVGHGTHKLLSNESVKEEVKETSMIDSAA